MVQPSDTSAKRRSINHHRCLKGKSLGIQGKMKTIPQAKVVPIKSSKKKPTFKPLHIVLAVLAVVVAAGVGLYFKWGLVDYTVA